MASTKNKTLVAELAVTVAIGASVPKWAALHGVTPRTAYAWTKTEGFDEMVREHRRTLVGEAVGELSLNAKKAVETLGKRMDSADERVSLAAADRYLNAIVKITEHAELEKRMADVEAWLASQKAKGDR